MIRTIREPARTVALISPYVLQLFIVTFNQKHLLFKRR